MRRACRPAPAPGPPPRSPAPGRGRQSSRRHGGVETRRVQRSAPGQCKGACSRGSPPCPACLPAQSPSSGTHPACLHNLPPTPACLHNFRVVEHLAAHAGAWGEEGAPLPRLHLHIPHRQLASCHHCLEGEHAHCRQKGSRQAVGRRWGGCQGACRCDALPGASWRVPPTQAHSNRQECRLARTHGDGGLVLLRLDALGQVDEPAALGIHHAPSPRKPRQAGAQQAVVRQVSGIPAGRAQQGGQLECGRVVRSLLASNQALHTTFLLACFAWAASPASPATGHPS
jgi:hypothetical protein